MENNSEIKDGSRVFKPGVYRHFKGGMYYALCLGKDSETEEDVVIYFTLYDKPESGTRVWVRPLSMFMDQKELPDGTKVNRFEFVSER